MNLRRPANLLLLVAGLIMAASAPGCDRSPPANGSPSQAPAPPPRPTRTDVVVTFYSTQRSSDEVRPFGWSLVVMTDGRIFRSDHFPTGSGSVRKLIVDRLRMNNIVAGCEELRRTCKTEGIMARHVGNLFVTLADAKQTWHTTPPRTFVVPWQTPTFEHPDPGCADCLHALIDTINKLDWTNAEPISEDEIRFLTDLGDPW